MSDIADIAKHTLLRSDLLIGGGRGIVQSGKVSVEIPDDRTTKDRLENRPSTKLREKILALPEDPGVYLYVDKQGTIIYVGKAKRLKRRVSSYFNRIHTSPKTNVLVRNIVDMRFIVVPTEEEALHLEDAMIKAFRPRYNVLLKDDKSYPYIVVTNEPFPRVFLTHERSERGNYYGPYANPGTAKTVLDLIRELFPLRSCKHFIDAETVRRGKLRLCLDYHIKKCGGACCGLITQDEYAITVDRVKQILRGETQPLLAILRKDMETLSEAWRFEEAQAVKEKIELVEKYNAKSIVASNAAIYADVFAYAESDSSAFVNFMHLNHGAVLQTLTLEYKKRMEESKEELLSMAIGEIQRRFSRQFSEVLVPFLPDIEFSGINFIIPQRGDKLKLLNVSKANAERYMADREKMAEKLDPQRGVNRLMQRMQTDFRLSVEPRHIECFDNSNIQGTNPVASCVVFRDGKPCKRDYRHFNIKTVVGPDDFASMKEVLHRRYSRMISEGTPLPQLVVVDGGKGQLSAAVEAFDEMGIRGEVALIGIAKRLEEIYFPGDSYPLYIDKKSESLRVIQALRDEAHRFGITHHRNRRSHGQVASELDGIAGIGPVTAANLMRTFKSVRRLKAASFDEIAAVVGKSKATILTQHFAEK
jgi:excinuclease ABC subunit C